jgi:hypothetical protein
MRLARFGIEDPDGSHADEMVYSGGGPRRHCGSIVEHES